MTDAANKQPNSSVCVTQRVIAYIDGFNLYFGMRDGYLDRFFWLDVDRLVETVIRPNQSLLETKYFTSRVSSPPSKNKRQGYYLDALATNPRIRFFYGKYEAESASCDHCGGQYRIHGEKRTDVNIAVEVIKDAFADRFDVALLLTADSDQMPTLRAVRDLFPMKRVFCLFPPNRFSNDLKAVAHVTFLVKDHMLSKSQLPNPTINTKGISFVRPDEWSSQGAINRRHREQLAINSTPSI